MLGPLDRYTGITSVFVYETEGGLETSFGFNPERIANGSVIIFAVDYKAGGLWVPTKHIYGWRMSLDYSLESRRSEHASIDSNEEYQQYLTSHPEATAYIEAAFAKIENAGLDNFFRDQVLGFLDETPLWYGYLENVLITLAMAWLVILAGRTVLRVILGSG
ncbi:MAG: hypothetical protein ACI89L_000522 [Phycisphaerales bacterium]|jgi:hypothetical protein